MQPSSKHALPQSAPPESMSGCQGIVASAFAVMDCKNSQDKKSLYTCECQSTPSAAAQPHWLQRDPNGFEIHRNRTCGVRLFSPHLSLFRLYILFCCLSVPFPIIILFFLRPFSCIPYFSIVSNCQFFLNAFLSTLPSLNIVSKSPRIRA